MHNQISLFVFFVEKKIGSHDNANVATSQKKTQVYGFVCREPFHNQFSFNFCVLLFCGISLSNVYYNAVVKPNE